ncbi:putative DUF6594 domain-containing protein [Seiridium cardinale]|uniref:DUF6594 domain-containing protein n=1 Tax=Seiridium cardinale TaxID=138064 RepID=A0ABR2Y6K3_9PEZI
MAIDDEHGQVDYDYIPGFGALADFIAGNGNNSTAIYRRFGKLVARDLLYYQSELTRLESIQDEYDIQDARDIQASQQPDLWHHIRSNARDWDAFRQTTRSSPDTPCSSGSNAENVEHGKRQRLKLAMEIRKTLKDYREALTAASITANNDSSWDQFAPLPSRNEVPSDRRIGLRLPGSSPRIGPPDIFLKTYCSRVFRTRPSPQVLPRYEDTTISYLPRSQVMHYSMERIRFATSFITTLTAAILLFLPIYTLYHTAAWSAALTLGLVALFTILFAGAMVVMTQARQAEMFGACAAYAAVLVVFVSGDFVKGNDGAG